MAFLIPIAIWGSIGAGIGGHVDNSNRRSKNAALRAVLENALQKNREQQEWIARQEGERLARQFDAQVST